jgi:hypothetical protein
MSMQFGVFDHMDRGRGSLAELYESRLQLAEEYDRAIGKAVCPRVDAGVRWGGATQAPFIDMRQRLWPAPTGCDEAHDRDQREEKHEDREGRPVDIRADHLSPPRCVLRQTMKVRSELIGTQAI